MEKMERVVAEILLSAKAVIVRPQQPFTWASGIKAPIYTDNRLLVSMPEQRKKIVNFFAKIIEQEVGINKISSIAGIALGGILWAAWLAAKFEKPMVFVRKGGKEYGRQNRIEGILNKGDNVLVIEDLISTGGSSIAAIKAIKEAGCTVNNCLAIFSYELPESAAAFEKEKVKLITLTNFSTLVNFAAEKNYIKEEEKNILLDWKTDPAAWAEKMGLR